MNKKLIALSLALVLCLGLLAGCGKKAEEPAQDGETPAGTAEPVNPTDTPDESGEPQNPADLSDTIIPGDTKSVDVSMEGQVIPTDMTKQTLTNFADGISLDIYVDTALYQVGIFEGEYDISPIIRPEGAPEMSATGIHFCYFSGKSADALKEEALGGRRDGSTVTDGGMVKLGDYDAYLVEYTGKDFEYYENVYYIAGDSGTLCVGVRLDSENLEGHGPRFEAMLNTLVINKAQ